MNINLIEMLVAFGISVFLGAFIIPKICLIAFRKRLFDQPNSRKVHKQPIPRLGGIAFFPCILLSTFLAISFHNLWNKENFLNIDLTTRLLLITCCMVILYLVGIKDDLIGVGYQPKFITQISCGVLLVFSGLWFDNLYGLFGIHEIPAYIGMPLTVFITVFILNAINLIDGLDGLASGLSAMAFAFFTLQFIQLHWWMYALISVSTLGVLIPFFYYNVFGKVQKGRKIFMGDTGSLTIGMILSVLTIRLSMSDPDKEILINNSLVLAFSFLIVPMFDVIRVVFHRVRSGNHPFQPDRSHIHHKIMSMGFSHRRTMVSILVIAFLFSLFNLIGIEHIPGTILLLVDLAVWIAMHVWMTIIINKKSQYKLVQQPGKE